MDGQELEKSRDILKCIRRRQLYRHVDFKSIEWPMRQFFRDNITPARIMEEIRKILAGGPDSTSCTLEESDVIVDFSTRSYGMRERNPVDFVRFYSKRNPDSKFPPYSVYVSYLNLNNYRGTTGSPWRHHECLA